MRIIDADKLKKDLSENYVFYGFRQLLNDFYEALDSAPSIDIVRCGECKYWRTYETWSECELWTDDPYESAKTKADDFCSYGSRSEKPNNCEHITEDGVTCAKYPACDDCIDNPLNKVKGSERLVKG